jgi:hypothetical protein
MSTKTSIKRIALVAAAALTLGGFSAVSASAAAGQTISTTSGSSISAVAVGTNLTSSDVTGTYSTETLTAATGTDHVYTIISSGVGTLSIAPAPVAAAATSDAMAGGGGTASQKQNYTANSATSVTWYAGTYAGADTWRASNILTFAANSTVAGTQTITITGDVSGAVTHTITWGAAPVVVPSYSTVYTGADGTATALASSTAIVASAGDGVTQTPAGVIQVNLESGYNTNITKGLTVTVSGPGIAALTNVASFGSADTSLAVGRALSISDSTATSGKYSIRLFNDGTAGVSTITISSGTTVVATKTAVFYGKPAKVSVSQSY